MNKTEVLINKLPVIDRRWFIRLLEIIPGTVTWLWLVAPVVLSLIHPVLVAYFIIAFDLFWLVKSVRLSTYLVQGYTQLRQAEKIDWQERLMQLRNLDQALLETEHKVYQSVKHYPGSVRRLQFNQKGWRARRRYLALN